MAIVNAGAAAGAAAAAAEAKRRAEAEEEKMTEYGSGDLDGWEFKILRSGTGVFKKPERLQAALEEAAQHGWVLVEKFDDNRLRLKRRADERSMDASRDGDPYATWYGVTPSQVGVRVLAVMVALLVLGGGLAAFLANNL